MKDFISLKDEQIERLAQEKDSRVLKEKLFDIYGLDCLGAFLLDIEKFDLLADSFDKDVGDKREIVRQMANLLSGAMTGISERGPIVDKVMKKLESDVLNKNSTEITANSVASRTGASLYYVMHEFKRNLGKTMTEYKNELKISLGKELLIGSDVKISEIATECGFVGASYFSEVFKKLTSVTPSEYRKAMRRGAGKVFGLKDPTDADVILACKLDKLSLVKADDITELDRNVAEKHIVVLPDKEFSFQHESAIISFNGRLFAAWYSCPRWELKERAAIRFSCSEDGGTTWSEPSIVADDISGKILYCPPSFGIDDNKLYMFVNQMVSADHIHSLDLYVWDESKSKFSRLWSRPIAAKLNTNVYELGNGKLMLPVRAGELDEFPVIPAVLISDSGKIDADWRLVKIQQDGSLPDGSHFVHPELSAIVEGSVVTIFCRNDERKIPVVYRSNDYGEYWSRALTCDIAFSNSKIYSGSLDDGRKYVVGDEQPARKKLVVYFDDNTGNGFNKKLTLMDETSSPLCGENEWHYPAACQDGNKLFVIYTLNKSRFVRGIAVSVIDVTKI